MNFQKPMLRKVAILVSSLEPELGEAIFGQLPPDQAALVREVMENLEPLEADERGAVIDEFRRCATPDAKLATGGVEFGGRLADELSWIAEDETPSASPDIVSTEPRPTEIASERAKRFGFLDHTDADSLLPFLKKEGSQTVAVVLSYLPERQAAKILDQLAANQQIEVMERLADLDETDAESLGVVERELESWVEQQRRRDQRQTAGLAAVRGILSHVSALSEQTILKNLKKQSRHLASKMMDRSESKSVSKEFARPALSTTATEAPVTQAPAIKMIWDDMARLDSTTWAEVLWEAEPALVILALAGGSDELFERATRHLARHDADALAHERAHLGPTRLSDVTIAQDELASITATLKRRKLVKGVENHTAVTA